MDAPHSYPTTMIKNDDKYDCLEMDEAVKSVEKILDYKFKDKTLLEMAMTHSSFTRSLSYERLEFIGDAALGSAIANYAYLAYPKHDPGILSLVKAANVNTEKLARVAIRNGLYKYVRHNVPSLEDKVKKFIEVVQGEENIVVYGGEMKAPKILADIVESVVAAIYVDLQFDLKATWLVIRGLLEPIITLDMLQQQPQPVSQLFELCQKNGHQVDIKQSREKDKSTACVYIDSKLIVSVSSDQKKDARLNAARAALEKSTHHTAPEKSTHYSGKMDINSSLFENGKIGAAKRKLEHISQKKKWSKPTYRTVKEVGPAHAKIYVCSVSLKVDKDLFCEEGEEKLRVKDAEGSAALAMLLGLQDKNLL